MTTGAERKREREDGQCDRDRERKRGSDRQTDGDRGPRNVAKRERELERDPEFSLEAKKKKEKRFWVSDADLSPLSPLSPPNARPSQIKSASTKSEAAVTPELHRHGQLSPLQGAHGRGSGDLFVCAARIRTFLYSPGICRSGERESRYR